MSSSNIILKNAPSREVADEAVRVLLEKKGLDVRLYDVSEKSPITDFYVNATGRSTTQVSALTDDVVARLEEAGVACMRVEGKRDNNWLLVDFGDVIVNVFDPATRQFYDFDRHLPDDSRCDISELVRQVDEKFDLTRK